MSDPPVKFTSDELLQQSNVQKFEPERVKRKKYNNLPRPVDSVDAAAFLSEDAAALEFVRLYGNDVRFDHNRGTWYIWTGTRWERDGVGLAWSWVRQTTRELSKKGTPSEKRGAGRAAFAGGAEKHAQRDQHIAVTSSIWDVDPYLIGTPNGVVDLKNGDLREARQADNITLLTAVAPGAAVECPRWLRFLEEITGGDPDLVRFLQQWAGYCLTGDTCEHALAFIYGSGGNGKSVFVNTIAGAMGEYARVAAMDTFMAAKFDRHSEELAALHGARLVTASETEEGRKWAEQKIKQITGGDPIRARFMRQNSFEFRPAFKLLFLGNHAPDVENLDDAMRRRVNIVPFVRKPETPDPSLADQLKGEWPGIFRWMIEGCLDWQRNGLIRAEAVLQATADYFNEQDIFATWLAECCDRDPGNDHKRETARALYANWKAYATAAGEDAGPLKGFASRMRKHDVKPHPKTMRIDGKPTKGYQGIQLLRPETSNYDPM